MRCLTPALVATMVLLAACGGGSSTTPSASPTPGAQTATPNATNAAQFPTPGASPGAEAQLTDIDFVDAQHGWAGGAGTLLATQDGGKTWQSRYPAGTWITDLDLLDANAGIVVGYDNLLVTFDGGLTWTEMHEPDPPLASIDFVAPSIGWGVTTDRSTRPIATTGTLVETVDGGNTWTAKATPAPVQSVCASSANDAWAASETSVFHTTDSGETWTTSFVAPLPLEGGWQAEVQCTGPSVAWVQLVGGGAAMNHKPYVIYRTTDGGTHWEAIFAEQYTLGDKITAPEGPGPYPGPFSLVDAQTAFVLGFCGPCGEGTTSVRSTTDGGTSWSDDSVVTDSIGDEVQAVSFVDAKHGWAIAGATSSVLLATTDGGRTWKQQYP